MKKIIILLALVGSVASANLLQWGNSEQIKDQNDTLLTTTFSGTATLGAFAQLVYTGAGATIDPYTDSGNGVSGDDVVVDIHFAYGINGADVPVFFQAGFIGTFGLIDSDIDTAVENGNYYVRVFNGVNINYSDGNSAAVAGVETITHYWDSPVFNFSYSETNPNENFNFTSSGTPAVDDWQAVPEPASMALIALGGVLTWLFNLKKRWS